MKRKTKAKPSAAQIKKEALLAVDRLIYDPSTTADDIRRCLFQILSSALSSVGSSVEYAAVEIAISALRPGPLDERRAAALLKEVWCLADAVLAEDDWQMRQSTLNYWENVQEGIDFEDVREHGHGEASFEAEREAAIAANQGGQPS